MSFLADDFHCVVPDLPGFGKSSDFAFPATIEAYASWLVGFVGHVVGQREVVIIGHSFGTIVVSAAIDAGMTGSDVVLINPIAENALTGPRAVATRLAVFYYRLGQWLPEKLGFALLRARLVVRIMSVTMTKTHNRMLRRWIHYQHDLYFSDFHSRKAVLQAFSASVTHDVSEFVPAMTMPVLLIVAENDDITPLSAQYRLAESLPQSQLRVIGEVGHLIHYEAAEEAAASIAQFVSGSAR